tara:strand:+ start:88 stop:567 length:480 start_codon:yes stop_codon:yes gene_type:complete
MLIVATSGSYAANSADAPVDNRSTYHINDDVDLIYVSKTKYPKARVVIQLLYPQLVNNNDETDDNMAMNSQNSSSQHVDAFNQLVTHVIQEEVDHFTKQSDQQFYHQKTLAKDKVRNRLAIDYSSAIINLEEDPLISVRFIIQGYATGMKQPYGMPLVS